MPMVPSCAAPTSRISGPKAPSSSSARNRCRRKPKRIVIQAIHPDMDDDNSSVPSALQKHRGTALQLTWPQQQASHAALPLKLYILWPYVS